jgi:dihydrofolate reductase
MKERHIIAAIDEHNGLGYKGDLLFRIPEDLKRFKALTTGNIVIMGRKTFESLGRALPNRNNIVVTSHLIVPAINEDNLYSVDTLEDAYELAEKLDGEKVYVIGGGQLYKAAMPYTSVLDLTEIFARAEFVDTYFPDYSDFNFCGAESMQTDNGIMYRFATYKKTPSIK